MFSAGEGLSVRRHANGELLIESADGLYRLFEPTPANAALLRLNQLGDRNDNRIYLDYDDNGRLAQLRDTFDLTRIALAYDERWPQRVSRIDRLYADQRREVLMHYGYDGQGDLAQVRQSNDQVKRRYAYDAGRRMVEHQLPTGLRCFYEWALVENLEWRVVRHWTDAGDAYTFDYDLAAGTTRITDGLRRISTRRWDSRYQIIEATDALDRTWTFQWNDESQLLGATDPNGGQHQFSYDEAGNLCETRDPLGRSESTLWLEHWALPWLKPTPRAIPGSTAMTRGATASAKPTRWATSPAIATTPTAKWWRSSTPPAKARPCAGRRLGNSANTPIVPVTPHG